MQCLACNADVAAENKFCEDCGTPIAGPSGDALPVCPRCGASGDEVDNEGFCSGCGLRRVERGRDHLEIALSEQLAGVTDRGLRHHRNEDYLVLKILDADRGKVLVVCDGVSSVRDPDVASAAAAERILLALEESIGMGEPLEAAQLEAAIARAQESVCAIPLPNASEADRPATTVMAAVVREPQVVLGWLGDTRAYWVGADGTRQLSVDHSWVHDAVESGEMREEDARVCANAHAITRWLGADAPEGGKPSMGEFTIRGPGKLVLCTDGLWNYFDQPEDLTRILDGLEGDALAVSRGLIEYARSRGGNDNITAAVLTVVTPTTYDAV